jgi:lysophospholipase L1-like esterase
LPNTARTPRTRSFALLIAIACAVPMAAGAAGRSVAPERVLSPVSAARLEAAFAGQVLRLRDAKVEAKRVRATVCRGQGACEDVVLSDGRGPCQGVAAGPFCATAAVPPGTVIGDLARILQTLSDGEVWRAPDAGTKKVTLSGTRVQSALIALAALVVALAGGAVLGTLAAWRRTRFGPGPWLALALAPVVAAVTFGYLWLEAGIWDVIGVGAAVGCAAVAAAHMRLWPARRKGWVFAIAATITAGIGVEAGLRNFGPPLTPLAAPSGLLLAERVRRLGHTRYLQADWDDVACRDLQPNAHPGALADRSIVPAAVQHRVLHLGDSMVYGLGVARSETFVAQMAAAEPGVAHYNAGVPGTSADLQYAVARAWLPRLHPKLVLHHVFLGNDLDELDRPYPCTRGPALAWHDGVPQLQPVAVADAPARESRLQWWVSRSPPPYVLRELATVSHVAALSLRPFLWLAAPTAAGDETTAWNRLMAVIEAERRWVEAGGARFVVVLQPVRRALLDAQAGQAAAAVHRRAALQRLAQMGVEFVDPWPAFAEAVRRDGEGPWFNHDAPDDPHLSPRGHALLARLLLAQTQGKPVAPPPSGSHAAEHGGAAPRD